jgi:hypothetical protein
MELLIAPEGLVRCIYGEEIDLGALGPMTIRRASHVEPDESGWWWADLSPVEGPKLGPFAVRSAALSAEAGWLSAHLLGQGGTLKKEEGGREDASVRRASTDSVPAGLHRQLPGSRLCALAGVTSLDGGKEWSRT